MTFAVYTDQFGYVGDVTAPSREAAAAFVIAEGYEPETFEPETFELRELED